MNRFTPLLLSLLFLIAIFVGYGFLFVGIMRAAEAASAARESALGVGRQELLQRSTQALLRATESERAALSRFVPKDTEVVKLINVIDDAADRERVSTFIGSVSVGTAGWRYHEPLAVALSAEGSFAALTAFATDLESLPVVSRLSRMTLEPSGERGWFGTFTVEFVKEKPKSSQTP